jgi:hypothetical protein
MLGSPISSISIGFAESCIIRMQQRTGHGGHLKAVLKAFVFHLSIHEMDFRARDYWICMAMVILHCGLRADRLRLLRGRIVS